MKMAFNIRVGMPRNYQVKLEQEKAQAIEYQNRRWMAIQ
jgi:hypothetical protein